MGGVLVFTCMRFLRVRPLDELLLTLLLFELPLFVLLLLVVVLLLLLILVCDGLDTELELLDIMVVVNGLYE